MNDDAIAAAARAYAGSCHTHGCDGLPVDSNRALMWIRRAAAQGNADGQYNLAYPYETGEGVPEDEDETYWLYSAAAAQGHEGAKKRLSSAATLRAPANR